ncbi:MAG: glutamate racemase [Anaerolineales bacterium]
MSFDSRPIGVFDSGVGGLSVLRAIREQHPEEDLIYIADQAHVPYGPRPKEEVRDFSLAIVRFLRRREAKLVVVACNTASAAALKALRTSYPDLPFVGMEPAVKPAAEETHSGVVGVLATPATFQGELYESTVERFAQGVRILQDTCPGLVNQIENGHIQGEETREILERALKPMLDQGVDKVVMGCTHYPFVIPLIEEILGPEVEVIDPAPAVARQVGRLLDRHRLRTRPGHSGGVQYMTSGDPGAFAMSLRHLLGLEGDVKKLVWVESDLREA